MHHSYFYHDFIVFGVWRAAIHPTRAAPHVSISIEMWWTGLQTPSSQRSAPWTLTFLVPNVFVGNAFLVPKLCLGMPSSTLRVELFVLFLFPNSMSKKMYLRVLCILQRGALREGIPKRSLGTREGYSVSCNAERCVKAFPNGVWERGKNPPLIFWYLEMVGFHFVPTHPTLAGWAVSLHESDKPDVLEIISPKFQSPERWAFMKDCPSGRKSLASLKFQSPERCAFMKAFEFGCDFSASYEFQSPERWAFMKASGIVWYFNSIQKVSITWASVGWVER